MQKCLLDGTNEFLTDARVTCKMTAPDAVAVYYSLILPFAVASFAYEVTPCASGCMARLVRWWMDSLPTEHSAMLLYKSQTSLWNTLFKGAQYSHVQGKAPRFASIAGKKTAVLPKPFQFVKDKMLFMLCAPIGKPDHASPLCARGCDALFQMISFFVRPDPSVSPSCVDLLHRVCEDVRFGPPLLKQCLRLVFSTLVVQEVTVGRVRQPGSPLIGEIRPTNDSPQHAMVIRWTDGRDDIVQVNKTVKRGDTSDVALYIILQRLSSCDGGTTDAARKKFSAMFAGLRASLIDTDLAGVPISHSAKRFGEILGACTDLVPNNEDGSRAPFVQLAESILSVALQKLKGVKGVANELEDPLVSTLVEFSRKDLVRRGFWGEIYQVKRAAVSHDVNSFRDSLRDVSTDVRDYISAMGADLAKRSLHSIFQFLVDLTPDEANAGEGALVSGGLDGVADVGNVGESDVLVLWLTEFVCVAQGTDRVDHLFDQPIGFWSILGRAWSALQKSELFQGSERLTQMTSSLKNRSRHDVLGELLALAHSEPARSRDILTFAGTLFSDNLAGHWSDRATSASVKTVLWAMSTDVSRADASTDAASSWRSHGVSLLHRLIRHARAEELTEDDAKGILQALTDIWGGGHDQGVPLDCVGILSVAEVVLDFERLFPDATKSAVAELFRERRGTVLQLAYPTPLFMRIFAVLHAAPAAEQTRTTSADTFVLNDVVSDIMGDLAYCPEGEKFDLLSEHLRCLHAVLADEQTRPTVEPLLLQHIPALFGGLASDFREHAVSILAVLLKFSREEVQSLGQDLENLVPDALTADVFPLSGAGHVKMYSATILTAEGATAVARRNDFEETSKLLSDQNVDDPAVALATAVRLRDGRLRYEAGDAPATKLVLTPKIEANLNMICEVVHDCVPLLLEGETGVGKSATVDAAAKMTGNAPLFRFNMSSRVTIEDFLGKVELDTDGKFKFVKQPFTRAFEDGHWLLLDEVNLAPDQVLQRLESVLDSGVLVVANPSDGAKSVFPPIKQHKNFRLFATQNPNAGFFRGRREELSDSFLSRFRKILFEELSVKELQEVVSARLESSGLFCGGKLADMTDTLMVCHNSVRGALTSGMHGEGDFPERGAYAEVTIRELLRAVEHATWLGKEFDFVEDPSAASRRLAQAIAHVYSDRFRDAGVPIVEDALSKAGLELPQAGDAYYLFKAREDDGAAVLTIGDVSMRINLPSTESLMARLDKTPGGAFREDLRQKACSAHAAVVRIMSTSPFVNDFGVYHIDFSWLQQAIERLDPAEDAAAWAKSVAESYAARVRQSEARTLLVAEVLQNHFHWESGQIVAATAELLEATQHAGQVCDLPAAEWPFVLTPRVLRLWHQLLLAMNLSHPILVTGGEAIGKSAALVALARIQGQTFVQMCLTPETDPSVLVGQNAPTSRSGGGNKAPIEWQDGLVTKAFKAKPGQWVILDNLNQGEASVLERLNPLLEKPAEWILSEKGETDALELQDGFRVLATMTPPSSASGASGAVELSPALYNRFAVVHFRDLITSEQDRQLFDAEMRPIIASTVLASDDLAREQTCDLCWLLITHTPKSGGVSSAITLRNLVRLLNSSYLLQWRHRRLDFPSALWLAFKITLESQVVDEGLSSKVRAHLQAMNEPRPLSDEIQFSRSLTESGVHVLTPSRRAQADAVMGCVECNMPVLLEGPAAVGKTSLIDFLSKQMPRRQKQGDSNTESAILLLRVNNSASTTVQDYLGSYLPSGDGDFVFREGALLKAMRCGYWFLADEFNLAEPAVMSLLYPILEGQTSISVPGTDVVVQAHGDFRFFATQNDAKGYAGRFVLPVSLRNRMLEVQVRDFDAQELPDVIRKRREDGREPPPPPEEAQRLANVYGAVQDNKQQRLTYRDILKWVRRKHAFGAQASWGRIGMSLFESRFRQQGVDVLRGAIQKEFGLTDQPNTVVIKQGDGHCTFSAGVVSVTLPGIKLAASPLFRGANGDRIPEVLRAALVNVAFAVKAREPVLLVGPSCYKSLLVRTWAEITGRVSDLVTVDMLQDSETCDIVGQIQPYSFRDMFSVLITGLHVIKARVRPEIEGGKLDTYVDSDYREILNTGLESELSAFLNAVNAVQKKDADKLAAMEKQTPQGDVGETLAQLLVPFLGSDRPHVSERVQVEPPGGNGDAFDDDGSVRSSESYSAMNFDDIAVRDDSAAGTEEAPINLEDEDGGEDDMMALLLGENAGDDSQDDDTAAEPSSQSEPAAPDESDFDERLAALLSDGRSSAVEELAAQERRNQPSSADSLSWVGGAGGSAILSEEAAASVAPGDASPTASRSTMFGVRAFGSAKRKKPTPAAAPHVDPPPRADGAAHGAVGDMPAATSVENSSVENVSEPDLEVSADFSHAGYYSDAEEEEDSRIDIPEKLEQGMARILMILKKHAARFHGVDPALFAQAKRFQSVWESIKGVSASGKDSKPQFLFRDGPVTSAVKRGQLLLLENFDLPNQAVAERLNSLLEPTPSFSITEDITQSQGGGGTREGATEEEAPGQDIPILEKFQTFATVHCESRSATLNLSPATRSRFTEVFVKPYSQEVLKEVVSTIFKQAFLGESKENVKTAVNLLFFLREEVMKSKMEFSSASSDSEGADTDVHKLFRVVDFVRKHHSVVPLLWRVWLGLRFFYFDSCTHQDPPLDILKRCCEAKQWDKWVDPDAEFKGQDWRHVFLLPGLEHGAILINVAEGKFENASMDLSGMMSVVGDGVFRMKYTGVCFRAEPRKDHSVLNLKTTQLSCAPVPTFVNQMARILAAISTGCPLLLEGPPGTGKTAAVSEVSMVVTGKAVARINLSANTTLEHLLGSVVPRCTPQGKRTFEWQDGKVVQALKNGEWLLLDEINLASPEVLDGLATLFRHGAKALTLPSGQDVTIPDGFHLFATMNPATIGGGRSRLPRSIGNLFASVLLEQPLDEEVRAILDFLFRSEIKKQYLSVQQLGDLFALHCIIKGMVGKGDIGRVGGPYEINLRDLVKVRDVLSGNSKDQQVHHAINKAKGEPEAGQSAAAGQVEDVSVLSLTKFAELVYAAPFHSLEDQVKVKEQIAIAFPLPPSLNKRDAKSDIVLRVAEGSVRIGSIYLTRGSAVSEAAPLERTPATMQQLEMLAAAAQSRRAVLLEGDTCSRKTALIRELARITRNQLVVIPMNEDTETSDLIGQWLPTTSVHDSSVKSQICDVAREVMKVVVLHCVKFLPVKDSSDVKDTSDVKHTFREIARVSQHFEGAEALSAKDFYRSDLDMLQLLRGQISGIIASKDLSFTPRVRSELQRLSSRVSALEKPIEKSIRSDDDQAISFMFVESEFVKAIRNGAWVVLDGVNSAPPEVIERLNSLLEERPTLNLYESPDGDELSLENLTISDKFRFFATANIYRKNSNKLSSAFLNRMIRIWLPRMDAELAASNDVGEDAGVEISDVFKLVLLKFSGTSAGRELALVLIRFHQSLLLPGDQHRVKFLTGFTLTYRCVEQTVGTMLSLLRGGGQPVQALVWSIMRNYGSAAASGVDRQILRGIIARELSKSDIEKTGDYERLHLDTKSASVEIVTKMVAFEEALCQLLKSVLVVVGESRPEASAMDLAIGVFDGIFSEMYPACPQDLAGALGEAKKASLSSNLSSVEWLSQSMPFFLKSHEPRNVLDRSRWDEHVAMLGGKAESLRAEIFSFLEGASFQDVERRSRELTHVKTVLGKFSHVLSCDSKLSANDSVEAKLKKFLKGGLVAVYSLETVLHSALSWTASLKTPLLEQLSARFHSSLEKSESRAAKWQFETNLTEPIIGSWQFLSPRVLSLLAMTGCEYEDLMPYCNLLQWYGFMFEFRLKEVNRILAIPPPVTELLSSDNVMHLEELFCTSETKTSIRQFLAMFDGVVSDFQHSEKSELHAESTQSLEDARAQLKNAVATLKKKERGLEDLERRADDVKEKIAQAEADRARSATLTEADPAAGVALATEADPADDAGASLGVASVTTGAGGAEDGVAGEPVVDASTTGTSGADVAGESVAVDASPPPDSAASGDSNLEQRSKALEVLQAEQLSYATQIIDAQDDRDAFEDALTGELALAQRAVKAAKHEFDACIEAAREDLASLLKKVERCTVEWQQVTKTGEFIFLKKRPSGILVAKGFLGELQRQGERLSVSQNVVEAAAFEIEFGRLAKSHPGFLTTAIGQMLLGTFLVQGVQGAQSSIFSQGMSVESIDSEAIVDPHSWRSHYQIMFLCGEAEGVDPLSLCVIDARDKESRSAVLVHHWHVNGSGANQHTGWVQKLLQGMRVWGLEASSHSYPLAEEVVRRDGIDPCVIPCFSALQSVVFDPASDGAEANVDEWFDMLDSRELDPLKLQFGSAFLRIKKLTSTTLKESDVLTGAELVDTLLHDLSKELKDGSSSPLEAWKHVEVAVSRCKCDVEQLNLKKGAVFTDLSCDQAQRALNTQLIDLIDLSPLDRFRVLQRVLLLEKEGTNLLVLSEVKRRCTAEKDQRIVVFEKCDTAVLSMRKVLFVFVTLLHHKHLERVSGDVVEDRLSRDVVEDSSAALSICQKLCVHVLGCIGCCSSDEVQIERLPDQKILTESAESLCQLLEDLGLPQASLKDMNIRGTIANLFLLLQPSVTSEKDHPAAQVPKRDATSPNAVLEKTLESLKSANDKARGMSPMPHEVLVTIRALMHEVQSALSGTPTDAENVKFQLRLGKVERKLQDTIDLRKKNINTSWIRKFDVEGLEVLLLEPSSLSSKGRGQALEMAQSVHDSMRELLQVGLDPQKGVSSPEFVRLHMSSSANMKCWQRALSLVSLMGNEVSKLDECLSTEALAELYRCMSVASEPVATKLHEVSMRFLAAPAASKAGLLWDSMKTEIMPLLVEEYISFRQKQFEAPDPSEDALLQLQKNVFSFGMVQQFCSPESSLQDSTLGTLLRSLHSVINRSHTVHAEVGNYESSGRTCLLNPMTLRVSDSLALFFAHNTDIIPLSIRQDMLDDALAQGVSLDLTKVDDKAQSFAGCGESATRPCDESVTLLGDKLREIFTPEQMRVIEAQTAALSSNLMDTVLRFFEDSDRLRSSLLHSSDVLPPWQVALSLQLFSTAQSFAGLVSSLEQHHLRETIARGVAISSGDHSKEVWEATTAVSNCRSNISRLVTAESKLKESGFSLQEERVATKKALDEEQARLAGLLEAETSAKDAQLQQQRKVQMDTVEEIATEVKEFGMALNTFLDKIVALVPMTGAGNVDKKLELQNRVGDRSVFPACLTWNSTVIVRVLEFLLRNPAQHC